MWISLWLAHAAHANCTLSTVGQVSQQPAPSVLVLGVRRGVPQDARRAWSIVKKVSKRGPVTLAMQAAPVSAQPAIDAYGEGQLTEEQLAQKLSLRETWGFDIPGDHKLLQAGRSGVQVVAVGVPPIPPPADTIVPMPPAYMHILGDPMGDSPVPVELEGRYTAMVAYIDHRVAARAIEAWSEQGTLVIVADRLHVEGSKGISWQAALLTQHPSVPVVLKASQTPCYTGDTVLK